MAGGSRRPGRRGPAGQAASAERREEGAAQTKSGVWASAARPPPRDPRRCPPASAGGRLQGKRGRRAWGGGSKLGPLGGVGAQRLAGRGAPGKRPGDRCPLRPTGALGPAAAWPHGCALPAPPDSAPSLCRSAPTLWRLGRGCRQERARAGQGPGRQGPGRGVPGTGDPWAREERPACMPEAGLEPGWDCVVAEDAGVAVSAKNSLRSPGPSAETREAEHSRENLCVYWNCV